MGYFPPKSVAISVNTGAQAFSVAKAENFFINTENYFIESYFYGGTDLVVTFEARSPQDTPDAFRMGWGAGLFRKRGISNLCIKPKSADWYRKPDLISGLSYLRDAGFFDRFERIVTYGGSMGGYASLAFADYVGATSVFSLNPQSTLDKSKVPWETRFESGWVQDWSGPFSEAADGITSVREVYIAVDMRDLLDRQHVDRIQGNNVKILNVPYVGHFLPKHLRSMNMLDWSFSSILACDFDMNEFRRRVRKRRELRAYYDNLMGKERVRNSDKFARIVNRYQFDTGALR